MTQSTSRWLSRVGLDPRLGRDRCKDLVIFISHMTTLPSPHSWETLKGQSFVEFSSFRVCVLTCGYVIVAHPYSRVHARAVCAQGCVHAGVCACVHCVCLLVYTCTHVSMCTCVCVHHVCMGLHVHAGICVCAQGCV